METLPEEVVEMIALFLSKRDLKVCCATSHTWRDIFSQDVIWKRYCNRTLAKCLSAAESRVEPKFVLSEEEHLKNLSPLGECRQAYLKEQLLWSHWRNGNYMMEKLTIKS
uniref:F-box domain-containing protein n=1 Tax=Cuerna arida TaxID=1464854 RepID=A0A1B6EIS8_9HEMI